MLTSVPAWSQVPVTGTVIFKEDNTAAPGVNVVEKGTTNGTNTRSDGTFSIRVTDANATLLFTFIGALPEEVQLKGKTNIDVKLKLDCNKDFFDAYQITLLTNSGVVHTPIGGQFEMTSPYTVLGVFKGAFGYQTNLDDHIFQTGLVELRHPISNCAFDMDFRWNYRNVSFNKNFYAASNSAEAQLNLRQLKLIAGYSHLGLRTSVAFGIRNSSGILVGIGKDLYFRPVTGTISAKVAIYREEYEYLAEHRGGFRWFQFFVRYYKLDLFDELSLGVGAQFSYYKRRKTSS